MALKLCSNLGISLTEAAYIGDDLNDIQLLQSVGFSAVPSNAPSYLKKIADINLKTAGGEGAFREFVEVYLNETKQMDKVLELYISLHQSYNQ